MTIADMVLLNGKIATVDRDFSFQEAVAVKDGWIIDVGTTAEIKAYRGKNTEVIDLKGRLMLPGVHDSHTHTTFGGLFYGPDFVDLQGLDILSIQKINEKLAEVARRVPPGTWIIGSGFKNFFLQDCIKEGRLPNKHDFDPVTPDHPVMLTDGGLHALVLNSKAMEICGITASTPDINSPDAQIHRFPGTREPTGYFYGWEAQDLVGRKAYHCDEKELQNFILRVQKVCNQFGITSHSEMAGVGGDHLFAGTCGSRVINAYEDLARAGKLTARAFIMVLASLNGRQSYDTITRGLDQTRLPEFHNRNWVRADSVKIFGDDGWRRNGVSGDRGYCTFPAATEAEQAAELTRTLIEVHRRGWQMGIHLTGGKGIDTVVDAYAEAQRLFPRKNPRHFLIHGSELTLDKVKTCIKYGIGLSVQPVGSYWFQMSDVLDTDPEDPNAVFDLQTWTNMGLICAGGSDGPALPFNWLLGLQYLVARLSRNGHICRPGRAMNLPDAIRVYTINGAHQDHVEHILGSIEVNKLADFQVMGEDLFIIDPKKIGQVPVVMTICGGKVVYSI